MTKIVLIALPTAILVFAAGVWASGTAFAEEFYPTEPPLADSGWTVRYNDLLAACYQGNMEACDRVASDKGMISDTPIYNWAATCGGRLNTVGCAASECSNVTERHSGRDVLLCLWAE